MPETQESEPFDPKRVKTVVDGTMLMCPEHQYPIFKDGTGKPSCFHINCQFDWPGLLVQLPAAFEPKQAAALLSGLPLAEAVQVYLDVQRADKYYARGLKKVLPASLTKAASHAALIPAGAGG